MENSSLSKKGKLILTNHNYKTKNRNKKNKKLMNLDLSRNMGLGDDDLGAAYDDDGGDGCKEVGNRNNNISLGLLNIRSLSSKVDKVFEIMNNGLDIFVITESWHG